MVLTPPPRFRANLTGSLGFVAVLVWETARHLPRIFRLAWSYRRRRAREQREGRLTEPRVLFVGDNMDAVHGISVSAQRMARDLTKLGTPTMLVGVSHSRNVPGERDDEGLVVMLPAACVQDLFGYEGQELAYPSMRAWYELLRTRKIDIVEIESPGTFGLLALCMAQLLGIPVVHNYRTDLIAYTSMLVSNTLFVEWMHWFIRTFLRSGGHVIVPSAAFQEEVVGMGLARSSVDHVARGVDLARFHPGVGKRADWTALGAPEGPLVVYLGRVSREKGLETLSEAFRGLLQDHPDAVLGVIGDGPYRATLEESLRDTGRAFFAGEVTGEDLPRLLGDADVFAFPSTTDTFGNAVVEALACGIPAVVTDQGGPCEIVQDGRSGLVVAGEDSLALRGALSGLLSDSRRRRQMGAAAIARAAQFDPLRANEAHRAVYRSLHLRAR
jgi:glycosyltransferase involved in cell wall biosynthesis